MALEFTGIVNYSRPWIAQAPPPLPDRPGAVLASDLSKIGIETAAAFAMTTLGHSLARGFTRSNLVVIGVAGSIALALGGVAAFTGACEGESFKDFMIMAGGGFVGGVLGGFLGCWTKNPLLLAYFSHVGMSLGNSAGALFHGKEIAIQTLKQSLCTWEGNVWGTAEMGAFHFSKAKFHRAFEGRNVNFSLEWFAATYTALLGVESARSVYETGSWNVSVCRRALTRTYQLSWFDLGTGAFSMGYRALSSENQARVRAAGKTAVASVAAASVAVTLGMPEVAMAGAVPVVSLREHGLVKACGRGNGVNGANGSVRERLVALAIMAETQPDGDVARGLRAMALEVLRMRQEERDPPKVVEAPPVETPKVEKAKVEKRARRRRVRPPRPYADGPAELRGRHMTRGPETGKDFFVIPASLSGEVKSADLARLLDMRRFEEGMSRRDFLARYNLSDSAFLCAARAHNKYSYRVVVDMARALGRPVEFVGYKVELAARRKHMVRFDDSQEWKVPDRSFASIMDGIFEGIDFEEMSRGGGDCKVAYNTFLTLWSLYWDMAPGLLKSEIRRRGGIQDTNMVRRVAIGLGGNTGGFTGMMLPESLVPALAELWGVPAHQLYLLSQAPYLPKGKGVSVDFGEGIVRIPACGFKVGEIAGLKDEMPEIAETLLAGQKVYAFHNNVIMGVTSHFWYKMLNNPFSESLFRFGARIRSQVEEIMGRPGHIWYSTRVDILKECGIDVAFT